MGHYKSGGAENYGTLAQQSGSVTPWTPAGRFAERKSLYGVTLPECWFY